MGKPRDAGVHAAGEGDAGSLSIDHGALSMNFAHSEHRSVVGALSTLLCMLGR
jgi:hypothetical protein